MTDAGRYALWYGRNIAPADRPVLHAGPVTAILDGVDLRHVAVGDVELVQRVYVAVRDAPWNTIPATISDLAIDARADRFEVRFRAAHRHGDIAFVWRGLIRGAPDGTITYEMDGTCEGQFKYSKIGFNVHHALRSAIDRPYRAQTVDTELRGRLPRAIDPQRIVDGALSGMFDPYSEIAIEVVDGTEAIVSLEGDLLELQDHRNWTDANFKSYGTPLALGFPFDSTPGQHIRQVLRIGFRGGQPEPLAPADIVISLGRSRSRRLPAMGFGMPSHEKPLSASEAELLRELHPAHLRVDLHLGDEALAAVLERATADAQSLGSALELALFTNESQAAALTDLGGRLAGTAVPVARVLVYAAADGFSAFVTTTPAALVELVRRHLQPVVGDVVFAGGTNQNFADINRDRPTSPLLSGVCFPVSPTVHAADDWSIVENLAGQSEVVEMARSFSDDRAIVVSPVTIATRFGPYPAGPAGPSDLPPAVDVRQASLLGAAWTVGSIAALVSSGAASVTWYETTGWRGIVETDSGSPPPARFPSRPGQAFPMFHVFADVAEWRQGTLRDVASSDPLRAVALAVDTGGQRHMLVANVTPVPQRVVVSGLHGADGAQVRVLDEAACASALDDPAGWRARAGEVVSLDAGRLSLDLGPFAVARVDAAD
jgi:hypothetical protein